MTSTTKKARRQGSKNGTSNVLTGFASGPAQGADGGEPEVLRGDMRAEPRFEIQVGSQFRPRMNGRSFEDLTPQDLDQAWALSKQILPVWNRRNTASPETELTQLLNPDVLGALTLILPLTPALTALLAEACPDFHIQPETTESDILEAVVQAAPPWLRGDVSSMGHLLALLLQQEVPEFVTFDEWQQLWDGPPISIAEGQASANDPALGGGLASASGMAPVNMLALGDLLIWKRVKRRPRCTALLPAGKRCNGIAKRGRPYCRHHDDIADKLPVPTQEQEIKAQGGDFAYEDVSPITTGPASLALRRATGGASFFEQEEDQMILRTTLWKGQQQEVHTVLTPPSLRPVFNWQEDASLAVHNYFSKAWDIANNLGPNEADWFDLLMSRHLDGWQQRDRNDPKTWASVEEEDLKRARSHGKFRGMRDEKELVQHRQALERLFSFQLIWPAAQNRDPQGRAIMDYFEVIRFDTKLPLGGIWRSDSYRYFPMHWFDAEMMLFPGYTGMLFHAGLRFVLQIPPNKLMAKAVARYLLSFWRMRAPKRTRGATYTLTLEELLDRSGVPIPKWALSRPSEFHKRFVDQLHQISAPGQIRHFSDCGGALLLMPEITPPSTRRGALDKWLRQTITLEPHPEAPPALLQAIKDLEETGGKAHKKEEAVEIQARARLVASQNRKQLKEAGTNS